MDCGAPMFTDLVGAEDLRRCERPLRFFDCRASLDDPEQGRRSYAAGHIPAAVHVDLGRDLSAPPGVGGRHPLPERAAMARRFAAWGAGDADQLVFYDDAGGAFAARGWWLARWCGHAAAAVLNGGLDAWPGALTCAAAAVAPGDFTLRPPCTRSVAVEELESGSDEFTLIDARTEARFAGVHEPIDPVAGHIPGAHCRPFQGNLDDAGRFLAPALLRHRFASLARRPVCYCGSGVTAAHNVLAMRVAGLGEAALYPGSWSEWIRDPARPVGPC